MLFVAHVVYFGGSAVSLSIVLRHLDRSVRRAIAIPRAGPVPEALIREGLAEEQISIPWRQRGGRVGLAAAGAASCRIAWWALWRRRRIAALHTNGLADLVIATPAAAVTRRPVVVWVHDDDAGARWSARFVPLVRRLVSRVHWVAVSRAAAQRMVESGLASADEVVVIPNPLEASRAPQTGRSDRPVTVGFFGTDTSRKGFDLLPGIARGLAGVDAQLLVFARHHKELPDEMERTWAELERIPPSLVSVRGRQDDVDAAYAQCDMVLCPSRAESFCRVAAEAMQRGLPVVGSDIPAIRELLGDAESGLLFEVGDGERAIILLRELAADPDTRHRLGERGRRRAQAFDPARVVQALLSLYLGDLPA